MSQTSALNLPANPQASHAGSSLNFHAVINGKKTDTKISSPLNWIFLFRNISSSIQIKFYSMHWYQYPSTYIYENVKALPPWVFCRLPPHYWRTVWLWEHLLTGCRLHMHWHLDPRKKTCHFFFQTDLSIKLLL